MQRRQPVSSSVQPLPNDFADRVLRLEISVDVGGSIDSLRMLLELYSQAIEFYESMRDPKFKYYQDRMKDLLLKQNTLLLASADDPPMRPSVSPKKTLLESREAEKTIKNYEESSHNISRQVSLNLQNQNTSILSRFNTRKSRNISAEPKPSKLAKLPLYTVSHHKRRSSEGECDKSGGVSINPEAEAFEKELEEIMEQSVMEKIERTQEIKKKYREQIEEIQDMKGNVLMNQLVKELEKNMAEELQTLESILEEKRKSAIKKIHTFLASKGKNG